MKGYLITLFCILQFILKANAQILIPEGYFRNPLDLPPMLAGTFAEIRGNHFHSGLDYRTNQREGYPVYAVADGYVSRLRIQVGGFGNAVYIAHPNGTTSVYAHLQRFNPRISKIIRDFQYKTQNYAVDFPLISIELPLKKGEIIAWSGNTGASAGPHLHFEIRDTQTEKTVNPQIMGFRVKDYIKPVITALYAYKLNKEPFSEKTQKQFFAVTGSNGNYKLATGNTVSLGNEIGFGISVYDQLSGAPNKNGIYQIELKIDENQVFDAVFDQFGFDQTRGINAYIDYPALLTSGRTIQKSFIAPNLKLPIFKNLQNNGVFNFSDGQIHNVSYTIKDASGNISTLKFNVKAPLLTEQIEKIYLPKGQFLKAGKRHEIADENARIVFPENAFYNDVDFSLKKLPPLPGTYSSRYELQNRLTPIHENFELFLKPNQNIGTLIEKAVIVNANGVYQGGIVENGYIKSTPRSFSTFYIKLDTLAPVIKPIGISEGKNLSTAKSFNLKISDNLSGIKSYNGFIDNQWVLLEFDPRYGTLKHTFDEQTGFGKHVFKLIVTDMKDNTKTYQTTFYR